MNRHGNLLAATDANQFIARRKILCECCASEGQTRVPPHRRKHTLANGHSSNIKNQRERLAGFVTEALRHGRHLTVPGYGGEAGGGSDGSVTVEVFAGGTAEGDKYASRLRDNHAKAGIPGTSGHRSAPSVIPSLSRSATPIELAVCFTASPKPAKQPERNLTVGGNRRSVGETFVHKRSAVDTQSPVLPRSTFRPPPTEAL